MRKYGILVGGGPAPGINSVISSVAIEAIKRGRSVIGIYDGYLHLMRGEKKIEFLSIPKISRIHLHGGSLLRTSRANPTKNEGLLRNTVETLSELEITHLVTIGGDDTAYSATRISECSRQMGYDLKFAHVPKTIDNDLPLPPGISTFGFETARAEGSRIVSTYYQDARVTGRWFVVVAMGRKAGHLALGIGKSAGATLTLIPEEFKGDISLSRIVDTIVGSIIKRLAEGRQHGVAIVAEGFLEVIPHEELSSFLSPCDVLERDEYGQLQLGELHFSDILKFAIRRRLAEFGINLRIVRPGAGLRVAVRGPHRLRRGLHPQPWLRGGGVPGERWHERPDHLAGGPDRSSALQGSDRPGDPAHPHPLRGLQFSVLPHRQGVHDPLEPAGFRVQRAPAEVGRRLPHHPRAVRRRVLTHPGTQEW